MGFSPELPPPAKWIQIIEVCLFAALAIPRGLAAQDDKAQVNKPSHHHYQLIVLGTLGGPQSYGDPGHGAANISNDGTAVGVADTDIPDPFYPNYNPGFSSQIGSYPWVYHAFTTNGGRLVDLGGLPGGTSSEVSFITANGLVSGQALNGSIDPLTGWPEENAVLWRDGQIINLGTLGGYESAGGRVNSRGQMAGIAANTIPDPFSFFYLGYISNGGQTRAFMWDQRSGMQDLGTLGGPDAFAPLINERGQIAGFSYTNSTPNPTTGLPTTDPFLWDNGRMIDLGTLGGTFGVVGGLFALNSRGQVVGQSNLFGDSIFHPFLWTAPGPMRDIGTLGGPTGAANAINDAGEVVGLADTPTSTHAFLWKHGSMTDLGTVDGDCFSGAFGINANTQVVGQSISCDFSAFHAFLWENGSIIDVNIFVPPGSNITLTDVEMINDSGEMFGIGTLTSGEDRAFLLIPCDEQHPGLEGCDYSMVETSATAGVSSATAVPTATSANQSPASRGVANSTLRPFGRRSTPWYRGTAAQPPR